MFAPPWQYDPVRGCQYWRVLSCNSAQGCSPHEFPPAPGIPICGCDGGAIGLTTDQKTNLGGVAGSLIAGGAVLGLGIWLGGRFGRRHPARGRLIGGAVAALPAAAAAMMGAMLGGGIASGQSPV